jgi:hypothetical protein
MLSFVNKLSDAINNQQLKIPLVHSPVKDMSVLPKSNHPSGIRSLRDYCLESDDFCSQNVSDGDASKAVGSDIIDSDVDSFQEEENNNNNNKNNSEAMPIATPSNQTTIPSTVPSMVTAVPSTVPPARVGKNDPAI